jgi:hypothetical protein
LSAAVLIFGKGYAKISCDERLWDGADMAGMHDGHRERLRQRIEKDGIMEFQQHEVLEYLLYYAAARGRIRQNRIFSERRSIPEGTAYGIL